MNTTIRVVYAVAIGIFVTLTVGFGTVTFFGGPEAPDFPREARSPLPVKPAEGAPQANATPTPVEIRESEQARVDYDDAYEQYRDDRAVHRRRVLAGVVVLGGTLLVVGVAVAGLVDVLRVGLMLGGLLTVIWGLIYAASDAGSGTLFVAALGVLVVLAAFSQPGVRARFRRVLRLDGADELLSG